MAEYPDESGISCQIVLNYVRKVVELLFNLTIFGEIDRIMLETRDLKILERLQMDSRVATATLAEVMGMSASALWRRIRALEDAGVIERYG
ncbi:MAG: winged helix-turn-helix transcriptional regulator, partial [Pseudomonadota bacterium]